MKQRTIDVHTGFHGKNIYIYIRSVNFTFNFCLGNIIKKDRFSLWLCLKPYKSIFTTIST